MPRTVSDTRLEGKYYVAVLEIGRWYLRPKAFELTTVYPYFTDEKDAFDAVNAYDDAVEADRSNLAE